MPAFHARHGSVLATMFYTLFTGGAILVSAEVYAQTCDFCDGKDQCQGCCSIAGSPDCWKVNLCYCSCEPFEADLYCPSHSLCDCFVSP
jgi:hypothetical protein